jgi:hypothetical protein
MAHGLILGYAEVIKVVRLGADCTNNSRALGFLQRIVTDKWKCEESIQIPSMVIAIRGKSSSKIGHASAGVSATLLLADYVSSSARLPLLNDIVLSINPKGVIIEAKKKDFVDGGDG